MSDPGTLRQPFGLWFSLAANTIGLCAGAVFLFAKQGDRFRGMEPGAMLFIVLGLLAAAIGILAGLPVSLYDLFWRRYWLWGSVGALLALAPLIVAHFVSELIAAQKGLFFE